MEIDKIAFEQLKSLGITQSFDDLDINKDGKIDETDKDLAKDNAAKVISNLISSVNSDDEVTTDLNDDAIIDDIDKILQNYEKVSKAGDSDDSSSSGLSEADKAKLAELKEQLANINKRIDDINAEIKSIQDANSELQKQQEKLLQEQEEAQEEADNANQKYEDEQNKLDTYTHEYDNYQKELDALNKEILLEQNREEDEFQSSMTAAVNSAIENYDEQNDGDFNTYFAKKMDSVGFPTFSKMNSLNWDAGNLSSKAEDVLKNIMSQSGIAQSAKSRADIANSNLASVNSRLTGVNNDITANNAKIASLQAELKTKEAEKTSVSEQIKEIQPPEAGSGLSAAEVLALIPEQEKCFAKELGWKLEDCEIAIGEDQKFHIYNTAWPGFPDWKMNSTRAYFYEKTGNPYGGESLSITPNGNGGLTYGNNGCYSGGGCDRGTNSHNVIYKFNSVNEDWTDGCAEETTRCYITDSPLSFDVDGNGIKTTDETISYDIDGDGELDTVNNSAEWVLAFDKDGDGKAGENGSELFGNNTDLDGDGKADGYKDGFEALKALAKKEGLIGNGDNKLDADDIKKLSEKYGLTMTNGYGGEAKSLADLGITEINLAATDETTLTKNFDGRNNDIMTQEGATFVVNGETRDYADIWNAKKDASEAVSNEDISEEVEKAEAKWGNTHAITTNLKNVSLNINKNGVVALEGNVDVKNIKNRATANVEAPDTILEEIVEIKDEKEIEE